MSSPPEPVAIVREPVYAEALIVSLPAPPSKVEANAATLVGQNGEIVQYANRGFGHGVLLGLLVDHKILSKDYVKKHVIPF